MLDSSRRLRVAALALALGASLGSIAVAAPPKPPRDEAPTRAIAIVVNGVELERDPAPRVVGSRVLVPVVRIYSSLGISVDRNGDQIVASGPGKRIVIVDGQSNANVDGAVVRMQGPATSFDGATYVPLRFVADSLGANVSYDAKAQRIEIVSVLVGRTRSVSVVGPNGLTHVSGTVTAVDLYSAPESVTVVQSGRSRTVSITSNAKIIIQDFKTRTTTDGTLNSVHPGDAVSIALNRDGSVDQLIVRYTSHAGTLAAVSGSAVVLGDGTVVTADKSSTITLNAQPATLGDLRVGDNVVVRINPETGERREIIASRMVAEVSPTPAASPGTAPVQTVPGAPALTIAQFTVSATRPLRSGESFEVTLVGTAGARASFDIGSYLPHLDMRETQSGTYVGRFTVPSGVNFPATPVYGHLMLGRTEAPRAQAKQLVSAATTPPQITEIAPPAGQSVNNPKPSIFATYNSPADIGIDPGSVRITVNGNDVTANATVTPTFITYSPSSALADGTVSVTVKAGDFAGNVATRSWTFTIRTR